MNVHDVVVALHHPVRRRISAALQVGGPATVGTLAEQLTLPVGSISHHLRALAKVGLVEPAPDLASDGRQSWWRSVPMSFAWSPDDFDDPVDRAVAESAELENAAYETQRVREWHQSKDRYDAVWAGASWATNGWMLTTPDDLAELGSKINDLIVEYGERRTPGDPDVIPVFVLARGFPGQP